MDIFNLMYVLWELLPLALIGCLVIATGLAVITLICGMIILETFREEDKDQNE